MEAFFESDMGLYLISKETMTSSFFIYTVYVCTTTNKSFFYVSELTAILKSYIKADSDSDLLKL